MKNYEPNRWVVVIMLFLMYTSTTISTNALPSFFPEIMKTFGWTQEQVSIPNSYYFIFIAIIAPFVGWLLTKFTPKQLMFVGAGLALISELAITVMGSFNQYFFLYFVLSIAITFSGLLPSMVLITNWFQKNRGLAVGIFLLGSSFGGIIYPQFAKFLIKNYQANWQQALQGVAILGALFSFVPLLFIKNKPADFQNINIENPQKTTSTLTLKQALSSPTFYVLLLITAAFWFCGFGVLSHLRLYLTEHHYSYETAINISSWFFVFSIIGKVSFGYFSDRYNKYNILILGTIFLSLGILALKYIDSDANVAYAYAIAYGFGYSGAFTMIQTTVADIYKGEDFSKVLGWVSSFDSVGGFLGVRMLGYFHTQDSNYGFGINFLLGVCVATFVMAGFLRMRQHKIVTQNDL